jgi:hypothetical protein
MHFCSWSTWLRSIWLEQPDFTQCAIALVWAAFCDFSYSSICSRKVIVIVGNGFGYPASCPGLDHQNSSIQFKTHLITRPAASLWAKPGPVPVNLRVMPDLAGPISSNLWFRFTGYSIYGDIPISYCSSQNVDIGMSLSFSDVLADFIFNNKRDTLSARSWKWESLARPWQLVLHLGYLEWQLGADIQKWGIGHMYMQKRKLHTLCPIQNMSVNSTLTMFGCPFWIISALIGRRYS